MKYLLLRNTLLPFRALEWILPFVLVCQTKRKQMRDTLGSWVTWRLPLAIISWHLAPYMTVHTKQTMRYPLTPHTHIKELFTRDKTMIMNVSGRAVQRHRTSNDPKAKMIRVFWRRPPKAYEEYELWLIGIKILIIQHCDSSFPHDEWSDPAMQNTINAQAGGNIYNTSFIFPPCLSLSVSLSLSLSLIVLLLLPLFVCLYQQDTHTHTHKHRHTHTEKDD